MGIVKCKQRARKVLYWPAMNVDKERTVQNCNKWAAFQNKLPKETLKSTLTPDLPFAEVGTAIFERDSKHYVLLVDYYSKFIEVDELPDLRSHTAINALKAQFRRHGILRVIWSDNGPQYASQEFCEFYWSSVYLINHPVHTIHTQTESRKRHFRLSKCCGKRLINIWLC